MSSCRIFISPCALNRLSLTAPPNITVDSLTGWENGEEYTEVACFVHSVAPAAVVTWHVGNSGRSISSQSQPELRAVGGVVARSTVRFPSSLYSGQNLSCLVEHRSLRAPERRTMLVEHSMFLLSVGCTPAGTAACHLLPSIPGAHLMSVSVHRQKDSPFWTAVCDYRGPSTSINLVWLLPGGAESQTSMELKHEGQFLQARLAYQFSLALHEGQNLTCVYQYERGSTERTVHVPKYRELDRNKSKYSKLRALEANAHNQSWFHGLFRRHLSCEGSKPHDSTAKPLQQRDHRAQAGSPGISEQPKNSSASGRQRARLQSHL